MNTNQALKTSMEFSLFVLNSYLSDLSDADLVRRPGPGCNHLAWQLGHLISSEVDLLNMVCPGKGPELPAGFREQHSKEMVGIDDPAKFCTKQQYQQLFDKIRASTEAALDTLSESDLDAPAPERMRKQFPTVGHMFVLIANHPLMHAGQFVVLRRELGKPVVI